MFNAYCVSDGIHVALGCHDNDVYIYELQNEGKSVSLKTRCKVTSHNVFGLTSCPRMMGLFLQSCGIVNRRK